MKNNYFLHILFVFIYSTILIAENTFPGIGQGQFINISLIFMLLLINYKYVNNYEEIFIYGFLTDSLYSNLPFGFFTFLFLIYALLSKNLNIGTFRELLFAGIYIIHFLLTSMMLHSFSLTALIINIVLYLVLRFIVIVILKK